MAEESIYNLIPKEYVPPPKQPLYRSKYSYKIPPTASTFGHHTTSVPGVHFLHSLNFRFPTLPAIPILSKKSTPELQPELPLVNQKVHLSLILIHSPRRELEESPVHTTIQVRNLKKLIGLDRGSGSLSPSKKEKTVRFPPIPKRDEKPIYGLKTKKNFIVSNAVEAMLSRKFKFFKMIH